VWGCCPGLARRSIDHEYRCSDQVRDKFPNLFEDLGEQQVKNIARPVRVYRVRDPAVPVEQPSPASPPPLPLPDKPSIAVLPFANMRGDPERCSRSDGYASSLKRPGSERGATGFGITPVRCIQLAPPLILRGTESSQTRRWREGDSNPRSRSGWGPFTRSKTSMSGPVGIKVASQISLSQPSVAMNG
jgi:hypothetical protein